MGDKFFYDNGVKSPKQFATSIQEENPLVRNSLKRTMNVKSMSMFRDSANLQLKGNTFDASHMDNFIKSGFGLPASDSLLRQSLDRTLASKIFTT